MDKTDLSLQTFASLAQKQNAEALLALNEKTAQYGLTLTEAQAASLAETQSAELKKAGRIELGGSMAEKLVLAFCDSPYVNTANYEQTLHELFECFYAFKNETSDVLSDKTLLIFMRNAFDHVCGGSTEQLSGTVLPDLARHLNLGGTLRSYLAEHADDFSPKEEA